MFWILANHHNLSLTTNKTTIFTHFTNWASNFHKFSPIECVQKWTPECGQRSWPLILMEQPIRPSIQSKISLTAWNGLLETFPLSSRNHQRWLLFEKFQRNGVSKTFFRLMKIFFINLLVIIDFWKIFFNPLQFFVKLPKRAAPIWSTALLITAHCEQYNAWRYNFAYRSQQSWLNKLAQQSWLTSSFFRGWEANTFLVQFYSVGLVA